MGVFLKSIFHRAKSSQDKDVLDAVRISPGRKVLNVGGNNKAIPIPEQYDGWKHVLLDIDPKGGADVVCDARELIGLAGSDFDSIYCSHNLEHYYRHDVAKVLRGFVHVLKDDGFAYIRVQNIGELMRTVVQQGLDIDDFLYQSLAGPITVRDVIYGYGLEIETSGNDFYAHKTGFTRKSLTATLLNAGFNFVFTRVGELEVTAIAFKNKPGAEIIALFNISELFSAGSSSVTGAQAEILDESASCKVCGNAFLAEGKLEDAEACFRQVISTTPNDAEAHIRLGFVLIEQKRYVEAENLLKHAARLNPELADAFYMIGTASKAQGRLDDAIENFNKALELKPDFEIACLDLCHALFQSGKNELAKDTILKGISVSPGLADFHYYLGNLYESEMEYEKAIACYVKALSIQPDFAEVHNNLGEVYRKKGDLDRAVDCYRQSLSLKPDFAEGHSNLLFTLSFHSKCSPDQYLAEAIRYGNTVMTQAKPYTRWLLHSAGSASADSSHLRVGLVSGDLRAHPVGFFLESILEYLNPARVEVVAYSTQPIEDALTARIKPYFATWRSIVGLNDEAAAKKIHEDGIHILIDLAGHTAHNRLPVFAWKPAPVQVSWLGYFATTGVPGMDYLLADSVSIPASGQEHGTEKVWYLPDFRLCFTPPAASVRLAPTPLPAMRSGYITFGCFQNLTKVNDLVLSVWGRIFDALPQARLRLQIKQMNAQTERERLQQRLALAGIAPERVTIECAMPREDYLAAHAEVDIILDTFPFPGGTTTCEGLWMGVPTVTLAGDTLLARQGASLLTCAGLVDWIAWDEDDYVTKAITHASDIHRLAQLRAGLREKVLASPLFDAPRFARNLEKALQGIWQEKMEFSDNAAI